MRKLTINLIQALRHMRRNIGQTVLIMGILSFALTAFVYSAFTIWRLTHEASHISDVEDVYLVQIQTPEGFTPFNYSINDSVACDILDHAPADAQVGYCMYSGVDIIGTRDTTILQQTAIVSPNYYKVMRPEFVSGRPATEEGEIVLSDECALALFGTIDVVGSTITAKFTREHDVQKPLRVTGVVKAESCKTVTYNYTAYLYKKVEPTPAIDFCYSPDAMSLYVRTEHPESMQRILDETVERFSTSRHNDNFTSLQLVPFNMAELMRHEGSFWKAAFYPGVFLILSALLLMSALFSYLALLNTGADARWTDHRLRICLGGGSRDTLLRLQSEVVLMMSGIGVMTFVLMTLTFDTFFEGMEISRSEVYLWFAGSLLALLLVLLTLCLIPVYLQNRRHQRALKGAPQGRPSALNYPLAVVQVAVSVLLLFLVWNGGRQIHFVTNDALGLDAEGVYVFDCPTYKERQMVNTDAIAQEMCTLSAVDTCITNHELFQRNWKMCYMVAGFKQDLAMLELTEATIDFFKMKPTLWKPMEGKFRWGEGQLLLSSNAAAYYGVTPEHPYLKTPKTFEVIGTLDLCTRDCHQEPEIIAYRANMDESGGVRLYFRFLPGREKEGIAAVEELLRRHDINPDAGQVRIINYGERIAQEYKKEQRYLWLYSVLSVIGLGIALFGLITLLSADLQRQRRALAIRRVFGAHYSDCLRRTLLTYGIIAALGTIIGLCVGYYLMTLWLQTYTLQITLGILPALGIMLTIALIILALVAYKVKVCFRENPAEIFKG